MKKSMQENKEEMMQLKKENDEEMKKLKQQNNHEMMILKKENEGLLTEKTKENKELKNQLIQSQQKLQKKDQLKETHNDKRKTVQSGTQNAQKFIFDEKRGFGFLFIFEVLHINYCIFSHHLNSFCTYFFVGLSIPLQNC